MTLRPPADRESVARSIEAAANAIASKRLSAFVRLSWPLLNPRVPLVWNWHMDAICEHLEAVTAGEIPRLVINVPPGHSKTTLVCHTWPAWEWLVAPHRRWAFVAYGQALTNRDNLKRRMLIESEWYQGAFDPPWSLQPARRNVTSFANTEQGEMNATSISGAGTGFHYDRLAIDDPIKASDIFTAHLRGHVDKYSDTWESRVRDDAAIVIIMQRLHKADLCGFLHQRDGDEWDWLVLPEKFEPARRCVTSIGWRDPRAEEDELLNPERFPAERIERIWNDPREGGHRTVAAQRQQNPVSGDGSMFRAENWRYFDELPDEVDAVAGTWDLKRKKTTSKKASAAVGQVWARRKAHFYLLDEVRLPNAGFIEMRRAMLALAEAWPECSTWYVELAAAGDQLAEVLHDELPGLVGVKPSGSKVMRADYIAPMHEAGNLYLPSQLHAGDPDSRFRRAAEAAPAIVTEFEEFPHGDFNDRVDAASQGLTELHLRMRSWDIPAAPRGEAGESGDPLQDAQRAYERKKAEVERKARRLRRAPGDGLPSAKWRG